MVASWLNHKALQIIKGIPKTPGDTYSAEVGPVVCNLMGGAFTLEEWTPEIAPTKNGGVWTDSPLVDGRQLLAAPAGNVTETMKVLITGSGYLDTMRQYSTLNKMVQDCRDYWQEDYQIEPVYLMWYAGCGAGEQYALISNMELAPSYLDSTGPTLRVSITIEREPYWRWGVPPGANPKLWTYEVNPDNPQYNINTASLMTGSDHLVTDAIVNKHEWAAVSVAGRQIEPYFGGGYQKNYVTIPAASVPGDAPALVEMSISSNVWVPANIYIGHSTNKMIGTGHDGNARANSLVLNSGDVNGNGIGTVGVIGATLGVLGQNAANYYRISRTVSAADPAYITLAQWGGDKVGLIGLDLDRQFYRGTYAVFFRGNNDSAAPLAADMKIRVVMSEMEDNVANQAVAQIILPETTVPITSGGVPGLSYMGMVTWPLSGRSVQSPLGYGVQLQQGASNMRVSLQQQVLVATANRIIRFVDLIFMPIDEGMAQIVTSLSTLSTTGLAILDNTGYEARGAAKQIAKTYVTNAVSGGVSQELRGQDIMLTPRMDNRIYVLIDGFNSSLTGSPPSQINTVRLNIVPRSAGIRTE
jgi:hypothetical protein